MINISLPIALHFYTSPGQDTATCPRTAEMQRLHRGDILSFGGQELLVLETSRETVVFARKQEYKVRQLGGLAYRRWLASWDEYEPAPHRAIPLRRTKPIWRNIRIPAGATGVLLFQAFAEGAAA